jgi:hypothetical protein
MTDRHRSSATLPSSPSARPRGTASNTREAFADAEAEMASVLHEGKQLESRGELDEAARQRIEARLQAVSERLDREVADQLSAIRAATTPRPAPAWQKIIGAFALLAVVGVVLEFTLGESFVFSFGAAYKAALPTLFTLTLPAFAFLWFELERKQQALSASSPTWAVRWLFVYPLMVLISSSVFIFSPFGWSALAGWAVGRDAQPQLAKVVSVGRMQQRVGRCDQKAVLKIEGNEANICIEGRVAGPALQAGDRVIVRGQSSFLGMFVEEIRVEGKS